MSGVEPGQGTVGLGAAGRSADGLGGAGLGGAGRGLASIRAGDGAGAPTYPPAVVGGLRRTVTDVAAFSAAALPGYRLRAYQSEPARAIAASVERGLGRQLAVVFSRQAGKDELLAHVLAHLLARHRRRGGSAVVAMPTFRPQGALCRDRLVERLRQAGAMVGPSGVRDGYAVEVGRASVRFLSAAPGANARGQTASLLLVANEAQDIDPAVWDAVFDPMAASTNATTVFFGTVWSREGLLARQMRHLERLQAADGERRVWRVAWEEVAADLPAYGERVRARIAQLGADHPFVRTEYCLEELDGEAGLFPPARLARMEGDHPRRRRAEPGKRYALLLDVAGEEESGGGPNAFAAFDDGGRRDSTALTVVEVDLDEGPVSAVHGRSGATGPPAPGAFPSVRRPTYRVVDRMAWTGAGHAALLPTLVDLARGVWRASAVVVDATGIGAGLASFLAAELGGGTGVPGLIRRGGRIPVVPFVFTEASKSALGWDFLGLIDAGRFKEYADDGEALTRRYRAQLAATTYETLAGPGKRLRWAVPAGRGHDDLVVSAALTAVLDGIDWRPRRAVGHGG